MSARRVATAETSSPVAQTVRLIVHRQSVHDAQMSREAGAKPLLRRQTARRSIGRCSWSARTGASLPDDLRRAVAFDDPQSSSGHLLPRAMLLERGYRLMEVSDPAAPVPPDAIGFVFSMDDVNTMFWVDHGKVAAGVTSLDFLQLYQKKRKDNLVVIERSISIPRQVVAHRRGLDRAVVAELERVLIQMATTTEGRQALQEFQDDGSTTSRPGSRPRSLRSRRCSTG